MKLVRYGAKGAEKPGLVDKSGQLRDLSAHVKDLDGAAYAPESLKKLAAIDPASLPSPDGLEVVPYVHNLYRHLAACDLAVVQGGLTTSMELTAQKRPFLYFPLRHHFEQNFHVRHRLERYEAGRRMDFDDSPPERIAAAIAEEIGREVSYREVETDGAAKAARRLAELL